MAEINNYHQVSSGLACSGQPDDSQLTKIAAEGFEIIVNLGLSDAKYALPDEAGSVANLGLAYFHIPVLFDHPQLSDLEIFLAIMDEHRGKKTLVHCAVNYRASAFTGLYLFASSKLSQDELEPFIAQIWQPNPVWRQFIEEAIDYLKKNPPHFQ